MSVHVGALLPINAARGGGRIADVRQAARHGEAVGLDGVWCGDHLTSPSPIMDSTVALAAAAAVTERIAIGYSVLLLALRQQAWAAKQLASLQYLSGGRLRLGVGIGGVGTPNEWEAAGIPSGTRAARTDAMLAALPDLFTGEPAPLTAEDGRPTVTIGPAAEMPEVWIGGTSEAALRRTVAYGQGWLAALRTPDQLAEGAAKLAAIAGEKGSAVPKIGTMVFASVTDSPSPDSAVMRALTGGYGLPEELAAQVAVNGSAEQLAERFAEYVDAGASTLLVVPFGEDTLVQYDHIAHARELLHG
ncbi:LLM class flavin-dependent oxidoreductase [Amycolatopsis antarctica]|uniref:LLM class flavin-dependent oxidoreductase n=1 Tax=Amycolatopsis antarctica TaxID=1854586 RepID=A0A263D4C2_9PSEU|nr:LLM class flavin-dependent oxidoreductase [Amycolatopsis antarctica]OZM73300.1 LLM class flavin-dependent oxidoreductase [Amycolatopsis antarctica]